MNNQLEDVDPDLENLKSLQIRQLEEDHQDMLKDILKAMDQLEGHQIE